MLLYFGFLGEEVSRILCNEFSKFDVTIKKKDMNRDSHIASLPISESFGFLREEAS